jgi:hypothetical protein
MREHAQQEAESLLALARAGETPASIRSLIGDHTPYRRLVLLHFDLLVARYGSRGGRRGKRIQSKDVSEQLKQEIARRLRRGWSHKRILRTLPVGPGVVLTISKKVNASYLKRGRGRRFSPALLAHIRAAVCEGKRASELKREFGIDYDTVQKFRREIGDLENRIHWCKLSPQDEARAEDMLRAGLRWRDVAAELKCALATIQRHVSYRKRKGGFNGHRATTAKHPRVWPDGIAPQNRCTNSRVQNRTGATGSES